MSELTGHSLRNGQIAIILLHYYCCSGIEIIIWDLLGSWHFMCFADWNMI